MRVARPVIVAANWKMNTWPSNAGRLAAEIAAATDVTGVTRVICPPYVCIEAVRTALDGTDVEIGAQDVHAEIAGAYTGEVSAPMLTQLVSWCIVGHSERRRDRAETDELIGRKIARCAEYSLRPIWCVGEQLADREAGRAYETVRAQLTGAILGGDEPADLVIAYEPVWAIGTGQTARGSDAAAMAAVIRQTLAEIGVAAAEAVPVLYGGSVTSATIDEFLAEPDLDGALVGGASLKVDEMAGIVARAGLTAAARRVGDRSQAG